MLLYNERTLSTCYKNKYRENGKIAIIIFRFTSPNLSEVYDRKKHPFENTFHRN